MPNTPGREKLGAEKIAQNKVVSQYRLDGPIPSLVVYMDPY